jgi:tetratricopeptide (TPR) repeat protein
LPAIFLSDHNDEPGYVVSIAGTCCNLGKLIGEFGDTNAALAWYAAAIAALEPVIRHTPPPVNARVFLRNSYWNRSIIYGKVGRHPDALNDLDRTIALDESGNPAFRLRRCATLATLGRHSEATRAANEMATRQGLPAAMVYDLACIHSDCTTAVAKDETLSPAEREQLTEKYAARAVALLSQAVQLGYEDVAHMKKDTDLDPLRSRQDFQKLLAELGSKAKIQK